jgi:hypothetical protein
MPWRARSGLVRGRCSECEQNRRGRRSSAPRPLGLLPETNLLSWLRTHREARCVAWTTTATSTPSFLGTGTKRLLSISPPENFLPVERPDNPDCLPSVRCSGAKPICRLVVTRVRGAGVGRIAVEGTRTLEPLSLGIRDLR